MTPNICLDANVFVSFFGGEATFELSKRLIDSLLKQQYQFYAPALLLYELSSALQRKCRDGVITVSVVTDALNALDHLPILFQWQGRYLRQSLHYAQQLRLKNTYDMSYLAVASAKNMPLVSWDREFIVRASSVYKHAYTPERFLEKCL